MIYGTRFIEPRNASVSGSTRGYCNFFSVGALHIIGSEPHKDFRPYHKSNLHDENKDIERKKTLLELASITMYSPWLWKNQSQGHKHHISSFSRSVVRDDDNWNPNSPSLQMSENTKKDPSFGRSDVSQKTSKRESSGMCVTISTYFDSERSL